MDFLTSLSSNYMLICAVIGYFLAQILKIIICIIRDRKLDMKLMFASGGMPSSHASTVAALCISCARLHGVQQFETDTELSSDRITDQIDRSPNING